MNDLISRQAAIDEAEEWIEVAYCEREDQRERDAIKHIIHEIKNLPSVQPQSEIIRCKDCKHSRFFDPCLCCYEFGGEIIVPENGFCFMAERRTDETD